MSMDTYTESSGVDTSPDMNSSVEVSSPDRFNLVQPRKLTFGLSPENNPNHNNFLVHRTTSPKKLPSISPPYRKVRALRLFDTPATPKTILQKSNTSKYMKMLSTNDTNDTLDVLAKPIDVSTPLFLDKPRAVPIHKSHDNLMSGANVNPFTPKSMFLNNKKRSRTDDLHSMSFNSVFNNTKHYTHPSTFTNRHSDIGIQLLDDESCDIRQAPKRLALQDSNISRYEKEFMELAEIGSGEFGLVFQCLNRLDGCTYAIKKSRKPVAGSTLEKIALNEVWAHAVLGKHENVVRYYSAWAENNHMIIQNEFCEGGSLQSFLQQRFLTETELRTLLLHISEGLKYIHSNDLVHMDLKAGNIFLTKAQPRSQCSESCDDGFEDIFDELTDHITYKIGDLGHVTSMNDPHVEEGDCRYLPNEILQEDFSNLSKADIFSLGITLYEAGGGGALPKNGPEWHRLRNGNIPDLPGLSREFNDLIKSMTHSDPEKRPSSTSIFDHPVLCPSNTKSKAQLCLELRMEKKKYEMLMKKFKDAKKALKSYELSKTPVNKRLKHSPIASDRKLRSYSRKKQRHTSYSLNRRNLKDKNKNVIHEDNDF